MRIYLLTILASFILLLMCKNSYSHTLLIENKTGHTQEMIMSFKYSLLEKNEERSHFIDEKYEHILPDDNIYNYNVYFNNLGWGVSYYTFKGDTLKILLVNDNVSFSSLKSLNENIKYFYNENVVKMRDMWRESVKPDEFIKNSKEYLKQDIANIENRKYKNSTLKDIHLNSTKYRFNKELVNYVLENKIWYNRIKSLEPISYVKNNYDYNVINAAKYKFTFNFSSALDRYYYFVINYIKDMTDDEKKEFIKEFQGDGLDAFQRVLVAKTLEGATKTKHFKFLKESIQKSETISETSKNDIIDYINKKIIYSKGNKFPIEKMEDINKEIVDLTKYKGKVILIDFWATWCGPCVQELPEISKMMKKLGDEDIVFISLSIDSDQKKWKRFLEKKKIIGEHYCLGGGYGNKYLNEFGISSIPRSIVIDKDFNIHSFNYSAESMKDAIKELKKLAR